ncbi:MAG: glycerate kinase [Desulfomonile tiedjei]|nr:glycerate kinase [Desulfomonile tiedjei]
MSPSETLLKLRTDAQAILAASIDAADPEQAVKRHLSRAGNRLQVGEDFAIDLSEFDRVLVVGAGKGTAPMALAVEGLLGDLISEGIVCVKYGHGLPLKKVQVLDGGHPLPDAAGEAAARRIVGLMKAAGDRDLVISCISGGGSALLPLPASGITLEEKRQVTQQLLAAGADIHEMNAVRKHLSDAKGGNLMKAAYPAFVVNLMMSDVIGDDPDTIASGPFSADRSTFRSVAEILGKYGLMEQSPPGIRQRVLDGMEGSAPETPKEQDPVFRRVRNIVVGSNFLALVAGKEKAEELGYGTLILSSRIAGDTSEAARFLAALAAEIRATDNPVAAPACLLSGGETTVVVRGAGLGGRNQHFVLSLARKAADIPDSLFLSAGTDGTDGPTDAAGALADTNTLSRALAEGLDLDGFLQNHDSYHFFDRLGDLVRTGPTRTNVMDVHIALVH